MSTLTLAVAGSEINHTVGPVGPVGIPIKKKNHESALYLSTSPRDWDLLSSSAPPAAPRAAPWASPSSVARNINLSWTSSSFSTSAPDLTSWMSLRDVPVGPLDSTPSVVVDKVEAVQGFAKSSEKKEKKEQKEIPKIVEAPKQTAGRTSEAAKAPKTDLASKVINIEKRSDASSPVPVGTEAATEKPRAASDTMPPLRKLKSSLKLPQLHKSKSASHLSPKSVRFASRLENVKTFDGRDSPAAVSTQNTPLGSPSTFDFDVEDYFSGGSNFTDLALGSDDSDSDSDSFFGSAPSHGYKISFTNFTCPQNVYDKQACPVYLQQIGLTADKKSLNLTVMCQNLAFEKHLSVKMTFNGWCSSVIYNNAKYVKSFSSINFDQFKFTIPLTHLPSAINAHFCIKYSVAGNTYWDNHNTKNYSVTLIASEKPKPKARTSTYKSSFNFDAPSSYVRPQAKVERLDSTSHATGPAKSPVSHNELVSKLMNVKAEEPKAQRVPLFKSWSATNVSTPPFRASSSRPATTPRPRYSQSYKARTASHPSSESQSTDDLHVPPAKELSPEEITTPRSVGAFHETQFNSNTYAALLRTYCFSGTPSANNSLSSSPSHSISNSPAEPTYDCASPASTFHTFSDSIHI